MLFSRAMALTSLELKSTIVRDPLWFRPNAGVLDW